MKITRFIISESNKLDQISLVKDSTIFREKRYYRLKNYNKDGFGKIYKRDGTLIEESNFKDGELHGSHKQYNHDNGMISLDVMVENGRLEGSYKNYYKTGEINSIGFYKQNKIHKIQTFDINGNLIKNE